MLILFSPTKTMNPPTEVESYGSQPKLLSQTHTLIKKLKALKIEDVGKLMSMSNAITKTTQEQYTAFGIDPANEQMSSAVLTYSGEAFKAMAAADWNKKTRNYADKHLCILSGLYGMLRPSDLIQPYRLEMAAKTKTVIDQTLYQYWSEAITQEVNAQLETHKTPILINLASQEYRKVLSKELVHKEIDIQFKEERNGKLKVISFNAKRGRGLMCDYIISNQIDTIDGIKKFDKDGYSVHETSTASSLLFVR